MMLLVPAHVQKTTFSDDRQQLDLYFSSGYSQHPDVATLTSNLADLYFRTGRLEDAERFYLEAITRWERTHSVDHPRLAPVLRDYAKLLKKTGRKKEAKQFETRASAILERSQSSAELRSRVDVQDPRLRGWK